MIRKAREKLLLGSVVLLSSCLYTHAPVWAEGSKDMVEEQTGDRPYTEWANSTTAGIIRQTVLQVYVEANEIIYFGSSVPTSANDPNDIVYRSPSGAQNGSCDVLSSGEGFIDTVTKELAGPAPLAAGGYTPCDPDNDGTPGIVATETGIYEFEMRAPSLTGNPPGNTRSNVQFATDGSQNSGVSAWDITVAKGGTAQEGRVFTNYVALNMGSNNPAPNLNSNFFIQTKDGFRYLTDMNGVDPFGFIFFSNNRGFLDSDGSTLYHSANSSSNALNFFGGVTVQRPDVPDTATDVTHRVFFNRPATETLTFLGIPTSPLVPPQPQNFEFVGGDGDSGNQAPEDVGGFFTFDASSDGSYQIIIDTNSPTDTAGQFTPDGTFDPSVDTVLRNPALAGFNVVQWDGRDNNDNVVPARPSFSPYSARIILRVGEYHFPMLDAENNSNGFIIRLENPPGPFPAFTDTNNQAINEFTVYYDDDNYTTANGTSISLDGTGATNPRNAAIGINSSAGEHEFTNNYGNFKGIDTWIYFPSEASFTNVVITNTEQANVEGIKAVEFLTDTDGNGQVTNSDVVRYTITFSNLAPEATTDATNFVINDTLPPELVYDSGSATITSQTAGNTITLNPSFDGDTDTALTNSGTLRIDDQITITFTATISNTNTETSLANQASASFTTNDNAATAGTVLTDADSGSPAGTSQAPAVGEFFVQADTDPNDENTGNNPTLTNDDDPTLITIVPRPLVLLVKRITQFNNTDLTGFDGNDGSTNDDAPNWPTPTSDSLRGAVSVEVEPNDEVEYTIYFLSTGAISANNVTLCDLIPENQTFLTDAFNDITPNTNGLAGTDRGIAAEINTSLEAYTNVADGDAARFYSANETAPTVCGVGTGTPVKQNTNGAVVINLGNIPNATAPGNPTDSYGFVRFRVTVD